jgi:hypothetical protein
MKVPPGGPRIRSAKGVFAVRMDYHAAEHHDVNVLEIDRHCHGYRTDRRSMHSLFRVLAGTGLPWTVEVQKNEACRANRDYHTTIVLLYIQFSILLCTHTTRIYTLVFAYPRPHIYKHHISL